MSTTSATRIDDAIFESARQVGEVMNRSASQQVTHWARIGRELESSARVSAQEIANVLTGNTPYDTCTIEEQAVIRAQWGELIESRIESLDLRASFRSQGRSFVEEDGAVGIIRHEP